MLIVHIFNRNLYEYFILWHYQKLSEECPVKISSVSDEFRTCFVGQIWNKNTNCNRSNGYLLYESLWNICHTAPLTRNLMLRWVLWIYSFAHNFLHSVPFSTKHSLKEPCKAVRDLYGGEKCIFTFFKILTFFQNFHHFWNAWSTHLKASNE